MEDVLLTPMNEDEDMYFVVRKSMKAGFIETADEKCNLYDIDEEDNDIHDTANLRLPQGIPNIISQPQTLGAHILSKKSMIAQNGASNQMHKK